MIMNRSIANTVPKYCQSGIQYRHVIKHKHILTRLYYNQLEMYRFTVFGLTECTMAKHQSACRAALGFYLFTEMDFGAFTHLPKSECSSSLGWMYPAGIPSRTGESAWKLPAAWKTSLPGWPGFQRYFKHFWRLMCGKVSRNHYSALSLKCIIFGNIQTVPPGMLTGCSYLSSIFTWYSYLRTNHIFHQRQL